VQAKYSHSTAFGVNLNDDLFIKRMPLVIKELIALQAGQNHRSVNQEAIALLEEALLHRLESQHANRRSALATLTSYAAQAQPGSALNGSAGRASPALAVEAANAGTGAN